eukprot:256093_1
MLTFISSVIIVMNSLLLTMASSSRSFRKLEQGSKARLRAIIQNGFNQQNTFGKNGSFIDAKQMLIREWIEPLINQKIVDEGFEEYPNGFRYLEKLKSCYKLQNKPDLRSLNGIKFKYC